MIDALKRVNWISLAAMLMLVALGTAFIWSSGQARSNAVFHEIWWTHLMTAFAGLLIFVLLAILDYRKILTAFSLPCYGFSLVLLVAVLFFGSTIYGGRRWLWFFQPSEVAKLCVVVFLAQLFGRPGIGAAVFRRRVPPLRTGWRAFLLAGAVVGVPVALVLVEPDLGTALVLVPAAWLMLFVANVWRRGLLVLTSFVAIGVLLLLGAVYEAERPGADPVRSARIRSCLPLREHQLKRMRVFLFPMQDALGEGYTLRQAKISIGSGGLDGKGIGQGENNHLKYLPQSVSMNDFIFCVYAEETGFIGSCLLLVLYALLLVPCCWTAYRASDDRGRLLALGIAMLVFAHVFVNLAMSVGLVPITGLPLPFMSSGRTFLVTLLASFGIVQSISIHREDYRK